MFWETLDGKRFYLYALYKILRICNLLNYMILSIDINIKGEELCLLRCFRLKMVINF